MTAGVKTGAPRLIVARHGRTAWNVARRFQGHADPALDDVGRMQSAKMASELTRYRPTCIISSDLLRAAETARVVAARAGCAVRYDERLREIALGEWEGLLPAEAAARFPEEYGQWRAGADVRRGGGETAAEAAERAANAIEGALRSLGCDDTLLVVSHGRVLESALPVLALRHVVCLKRPFRHLDNGTFAVVPCRASALL